MSYVSIEANIGVGKSTLLPLLSEKLSLIPIEEDLSSEDGFISSLREYNEDKTKALDLQTSINLYRVEVARGTVFGQYLLERSMMSDVVFAKVMTDRGEMSKGDYKLFLALTKTGLTLYPPDLVVHLSCDPNVAYDRMMSRGREEESNNSLEYIKALEDAHDDILPKLCEEFNRPYLKIEYTNFCDPSHIAEMILSPAASDRGVPLE
jgi:deoxyadenosine/deoxycytidine kinase